jgi:uncharacterized protein
MLNIIKTLIYDFKELQLETGVPRQTDIEPVPGKVTVCIGVRRSGKSTYMFQVMNKLFQQGVSKENILYLNFFDDRLHGIKTEGFSVIIDAYYALYPEKKNAEKIYCFFDEIQMIEGWEPFVERLMRTENCEIYITGSSANLLSKEIATQMRGRALSWEMFPFSFKEFLSTKNINSSEPFSTKLNLLIQKHFNEYWEKGGFPEVINVSDNLRVKIHQEYFHSVLFRDLIDRHNIAHPKALTDLAYKLIDNISSLYSINKLTNYLQSLGYKIPKAVVSNFIAWFEDAYFLFTVRLFDASISRSNANPKKIYCIDHSLVKSVSSGILVNSGHFLENLVFMALRRQFSSVFYYKTKSGKEVDFIVQKQGLSKQLIQVSESLVNENTEKREVSALIEAMEEQNLSSGIIITRGEKKQIKIDTKFIDVVPIWEFLLTLYS